MSSFRFRRVRTTGVDWVRRDAGPLLATRRNGGASAWWRFIGSRYRTGDINREDDVDLAMPYPRAASGPLSLKAWMAPWSEETPLAAKALDFASQLIWLAPGLLVLMPADYRAFLGIAFGLAVLALRRAGRFAHLRTERTENIAIHGRLWDRMLDLPADLIKGRPRQQSGDLSSGLDAVFAQAELRRRGPVLACLFVAAGILALICNVWLAAILIGASLIGAGTAGVLAHRATKMQLVSVRPSLELQRQRSWTMGNMVELRGLGVIERFIALLGKGTDSALTRTLHLKRAYMASMMAAGWILILGVAVIASAWLAGFGGSTPRNALAVLLFAAPALYAAAEVGRLRGTAIARRPALDAIRPVTEYDMEVSNEADSLQVGSIDLDRVAFSYPDSSPLFQGLSLNLKRGEVLALNGPSGGGKSTLLRIFMGLLAPSSGILSVNGTQLTTALGPAYRLRIAAVFQDQDLGFSTIRTAVLQDMPGADLADAWSALDAAGLGDAVRAMPMGIQTLLVAGAFPFSLTRQVLIARALLQKPDVLILDEALSALDADTVGSIIACARERGSLVIYSTHRHELLGFADRVITLGT